MKSSTLLFIWISLFASNSFSQKFTIKSDNGNIFYLDKSHKIRVKVDGYDSSRILATASKPGVLSGENGNYTVNLDQGHLGQQNIDDSIRISLFVLKADENYYMIGGKTFWVSRKNDFGMGLDYFRSGDELNESEFDKLEKIGVAMDDALTIEQAKGYEVVRFECLLIPENGDAQGISVVGNRLSAEVKLQVKAMGNKGQIIVDDMVLKNKMGDTKSGSRIFLNLNKKAGTYLYPFFEKREFSVKELLSIKKFSAQKGPDSPEAGSVYSIKSFTLFVVPLKGEVEGFMLIGDTFSEQMLKRFKEKLKSGDQLIFDDIVYWRPDGSMGHCPMRKVYIK